jgi:hypothetical protein
MLGLTGTDFLAPKPRGLVTIFYCLKFEPSSNLKDQFQMCNLAENDIEKFRIAIRWQQGNNITNLHASLFCFVSFHCSDVLSRLVEIECPSSDSNSLTNADITYHT